MALGEMHKVDSSSHDGAQFILKQKRELSTGTYYYALNGTRYKSLEQLYQDLFDVEQNGTNTTPLYMRRDDCLKYLEDLSSYIRASTVNLAGTREAQLLLLDPFSKKLLNSVSELNQISKLLLTLKTSLEHRYRTPKSWAKGSSAIGDQLKNHMALLRRLSHDVVHSDDGNSLSGCVAFLTCTVLNQVKKRLEFDDRIFA